MTGPKDETRDASACLLFRGTISASVAVLGLSSSKLLLQGVIWRYAERC